LNGSRTITVVVVAHAGLVEPTPDEEPGYNVTRELRLDARDPTIARVVSQLGLAPGDVGVTTVNGAMVDEKRLLVDGDEVHVYPYFGGG